MSRRSFELQAPGTGDAAVESASLTADAAWWELQLAAPATLDWPTDRPRPATPSPSAGRVTRTCGPALTRALDRLVAPGIDRRAVALAGLLALLHRTTGLSDLVVAASPHADDDEPLPLRVHLTAGDSFHAALERTRDALAEALTHGAPALRLAADRDRRPALQVRFAPAVRPAPPEIPHELELACDDGRLVADHRLDLFDAATIERLLGHWETLLL